MKIMHSCGSTLAMAAMLTAAIPTSGTANAQADSQQAPMRQRLQGFCYNPAPMPQLAGEIDNEQQQQRPVPSGTRRDRRIDPAAPPPPPPPPASPSPAIVAPDGAASDASAGTARTSGRVSSETARPRDLSPPASPAPPGRASAERTRPVILPPGSPPRPSARPQAGILTAGEHDDLLNPLLYARYVNGSPLGQVLPDLPVVDTDRVLRVQVTDAGGRPMRAATVTVTCSDGGRIRLNTLADGQVVFFPGLDRLSPNVTISAVNGRTPVGSPVNVQVQNQPGGQQINLVARTGAYNPQRAQQLDLAFVIDTTGSMGDEIRYLQSELSSIVSSLQDRHPGASIRIAFIFYRDRGDAFVTRTVSFNGNTAQAQSVLMGQHAAGGGDYPEAMDEALLRGVGLDWRPGAVRSLVLVADAPPHDRDMARTWHAAELARQARIHIVPVAASGVADRAEYAMRAMAAVTQSRYLFLTDDSGVGNPHAPPAVDCYLVTRLDALLRRVIDSQLSGRRIEPTDQEVIRRVGDYDNGRCILPDGFQTRPT